MEVQLSFKKVAALLESPTYFRSLIGSLRYLTQTQPDLVYSVSCLSRFMEKPTNAHMNSDKRILRYRKGMTKYALVYEKGQKSIVLHGYSDFSRDSANWKST